MSRNKTNETIATDWQNCVVERLQNPILSYRVEGVKLVNDKIKLIAFSVLFPLVPILLDPDKVRKIVRL